MNSKRCNKKYLYRKTKRVRKYTKKRHYRSKKNGGMFKSTAKTTAKAFAQNRTPFRSNETRGPFVLPQNYGNSRTVQQYPVQYEEQNNEELPLTFSSRRTPAPNPYLQAPQISIDMIRASTEVLENGIMNIEFLSTFQPYIFPKLNNKFEQDLNIEYNRLIQTSTLTPIQKEMASNLENKNNWIGWSTIANVTQNGVSAITNTIQSGLRATATGAYYGAIDITTILFSVTRTLTLTTAYAFDMITPTFVSTTVGSFIPKNIKSQTIVQYTILDAIDSGAFASIISLAAASLFSTDWKDKKNINKFYDDLTDILTRVLPVLLQDITKEGCKTLIPSVINHVAAEASLAHIALNEGYKLIENTELGNELLENVTYLGNVVVPLILTHIKKNGVSSCFEELLSTKCLGEDGYAKSEDFFNKSLQAIAESMNYCIQEQKKDFFKALIDNDTLPGEAGNMLQDEIDAAIDNENFTEPLLSKMKKICIASIASDINEVCDTTNKQLAIEMSSIETEGLRETIQRLDVGQINIIQSNETTKNRYTGTSKKVSIEKITTKFGNGSGLLEVLQKWGENIKENIGEGKPYSRTECLLQAIDIRFPHILNTLCGVQNDNLLTAAELAFNQPADKIELEPIFKSVIEEYIKPIAITMCIENYIKPENYSDLKIASLFTFFMIRETNYPEDFVRMEEID